MIKIEDLKECPKCKSKLKKHSTVKLRGNDNIKIVDYHQFCTNMDCDFEIDLEQKPKEV